jgi:hypothetical protein
MEHKEIGRLIQKSIIRKPRPKDSTFHSSQMKYHEDILVGMIKDNRITRE